MSERMEIRPEVSPAATSQPPFAQQPPTVYSGPNAGHPGQGSLPQSGAGFMMKPYLIGAVITFLLVVLVVQQVQINRLSEDLALVSDSVKSSDVRNRLESQEASLGELNTRLSYLDSKINAVDQKAQSALERIKAHEENDLIGNMIKSIKNSLGIK